MKSLAEHDAVIALLASQYAQACDYTPDPVTIPPTIEVRI